MPNYKLAYVRVFVSDYERSVHFYTETLGMKPSMRMDEMRWCQFETGEASLAIEGVSPDDDEAETFGPRFVAVSLQLDDIDAVYAELTSKGVEFLGPP